MKTLFVVALLNVKLHGSFGRGLRLSETQFLTNEALRAAALLSADFERIAGSLETDAIRKAPGVIYEVTEHDTAAFNDDEARRFLNQRLALVQLFLMALWLVKDNAVNVELGFLEHPYRDPIRISVSSNSRAIRFSDAADEFPVYEFLEQELRDARDIYVALFEKNALQIDLALSTRTVSPESTRFDRVLYFAQGARGASDLGMKVATYVTCFESLFSTETSELAHKLAERVAFFCGDTPATRFEVFKTVKVAYTIRSRTVHGDKLPAKLAAQAKPTAQQCDALLRSALNKILTAPGMYEVFVGSPDKLENYLTRLVFGVGDGCLGA